VTKEIIYTYLGTNGTISSPVYLEGIYSTKKIHLIADDGKVITKDGTNFVRETFIPINEEATVKDWYEIKKPAGQVKL
jgi:hypothetical protein